jgi:hypothetical protein
MTTFRKDLNFYHTRDSAVKDVNIQDYMLLAKDKKTIDARNIFMRLPISDFDDYLQDILMQNRNFYEIYLLIFQ